MRIELAALSLSLLAASPALAEQFGDKGVIAPSGEITLSMQTVSSSGFGRGTTTGTFALRPGAMFFIMPGLAIGGSLQLESNIGSGASGNSFGLMPEVGYNVRLAQNFSMFPHGGIGYFQGAAQYNFAGNWGTWDTNRLTLSANLPFLFHLGHFYIGGGPTLSADLWAQMHSGGWSYDANKTTGISLTTVMGGWF